MSWSLFKYAIIFALALPACNARPEEGKSQASPGEGTTQAAPGSETGDPAVVHHPEPPARPEQKTDSIQIEGDWTKFTARLVKPTMDVPFSTYLPLGMAFEQNSSGEGAGFYFYTAFDGKKNENAFMLVFMLPQGATAADARKLADAFVSSRKSARQVARVELGNYQGRPFYVARTYPAEFGDGMGPRTHYIRQQWIWLNDGKSLESTLQSPSE